MQPGRDPLRKVVTGEPIVIPSQTWNGFIDVLADFRNRQRNQRFDDVQSLKQTGIIRVKNASGATVNRFGILGVATGGPIITPSANLLAFQDEPTLIGETPSFSDDLGSFVVTLEPITDGHIGRAVISGIAVVQVNVNHDDHLWADVRDSDATQLDTSHSGAAQILYRESGSSGTKWAIVRIGAFGPQTLIGRASGPILKGTSGTVKVYIGTPGSEVDSGLTVTAFNKFADVDDTKWVGCNWNGFGWYLIAAEC